MNGSRYNVNSNQKEVRQAILLSEKSYIIAKNIIRYKEGHFIKIQGSFYQESITILCLFF